MTDITLVNLNMLFVRHGERVERELHVPLGPLYLVTALERAGLSVDLRDYQLVDATDPFDLGAFLDFVANPARIVGISCMANLLPFAVLATRALRERYPDRVLILGGVGPTSVEEKILSRFPWIDVICRGEAEASAPVLLEALIKARGLDSVPGVSFRDNGGVKHNPAPPRFNNLDALPPPAWHTVDLKRYAGYGVMTSRGCPYPCTFCSVAPIWNHESYLRSPDNIVAEMSHLNHEFGVDMFLFQDEYFVGSKARVMKFCGELRRAKLDAQWKAFARVDLVDREAIQAMADAGCVELRFGIESGSDRILQTIKKGFTTRQAIETVAMSSKIMPRTDTFFMWGFPSETIEDFSQTLFQMVSFRMMGVRVLPSLLSLLPQTEIFRSLDSKTRLEFCSHLLPEFVLTGHESISDDGQVSIDRHQDFFDLIQANPDIFPGFFHADIAHNVQPKLEMLRQFGFYAKPKVATAKTESCGAHSPS
jgi:anaerobic magnesium-protoporphyrin IX monomethyl ester cyclase